MSNEINPVLIGQCVQSPQAAATSLELTANNKQVTTLYKTLYAEHNLKEEQDSPTKEGDNNFHPHQVMIPRGSPAGDASPSGDSLSKILFLSKSNHAQQKLVSKPLHHSRSRNFE